MSTLLTASGSFLLGVLCMDLAFDLPAMMSSGETEAVPVPIRAYYMHILGNENPMANVVVVVMLTSVLGAVYQTVSSRDARWLPAAALLFAVLAIGSTATLVVSAANQLVESSVPSLAAAATVRKIAITHIFCFAAFLIYVAIQASLSLRWRNRRADS